MIPHTSKSILALGLGLASFTGIQLLQPAAPAPAPTAPAAPGGLATWEVSVTNITRGQILSPAVVYTHTAGMKPLFTLGSPASDELAGVAEDANNPALIAALQKSSKVGRIAEIKGKNGPILPGETATVTIQGSLGFFGRGRRFDHVSMASMLVVTNDAFTGLNGVRAPFRGAEVHMTPAYDAGSEANNEDGSYIPGPPFGNGGKRATAGAEGYVHMHAGVHGIKDLVPSDHDWRGNVAKVRIRRVR